MTGSKAFTNSQYANERLVVYTAHASNYRKAYIDLETGLTYHLGTELKLTTTDFANQSVTSAILAPNAVLSGNIGPGEVKTNNIQDAAVTPVKTQGLLRSANNLSDLQNLAAAQANLGLQAMAYQSRGVPVGSFMFYLGLSVPTGWLELNGDTIGNTASGANWSGDLYKDLYILLWSTGGFFMADGGNKGSDPNNDWNGGRALRLVDVRGEFVRGWDNGRGVDVGRMLGSSQVDELKSHTHILNTSAIYDTSDTPPDVPVNRVQGSLNGGEATQQPALPEINNQNYIVATGGSETRPRNIAMMGLVKY